jgi:hypothetical protein
MRTVETSRPKGRSCLRGHGSNEFQLLCGTVCAISFGVRIDIRVLGDTVAVSGGAGAYAWERGRGSCGSVAPVSAPGELELTPARTCERGRGSCAGAALVLAEAGAAASATVSAIAGAMRRGWRTIVHSLGWFDRYVRPLWSVVDRLSGSVPAQASCCVDGPKWPGAQSLQPPGEMNVGWAAPPSALLAAMSVIVARARAISRRIEIRRVDAVRAQDMWVSLAVGYRASSGRSLMVKISWPVVSATWTVPWASW